MTTTAYLIITSLLFSIVGAGLLFWSMKLQKARSVEDNLAKSLGKPRAGERVIRGGQRLWGKTKRSNATSLNDILEMMRKAGYISNREQTLCIFRLAAVWCAIQLVFASQLIQADASANHKISLMLISAMGTAYLVIQWLKKKAVKRTQMIEEELIIGLQVMKILWDVGLSLESLLRTLSRELSELTPELNKELKLALSKIEAGQERASVFSEIARVNDSAGMQDLLTMLAQVSETGGNMSASLNQLSVLLQDRRRTQLQEKVTKLSGKMSVVMMVFLFPALFVVLAGPGMMALIQAIGGS
ncbi:MULTISPECIES: type II secretion system F family protein [unclassified Photobacterium]|uniref:type II secretion system F family protein n=1 Tax=unclassified Photobacterium TaxID=2628852 RepID=UPI001B8BDF1F|nr:MULTISPECIES: type II secretion system F family protein [unclassified Photobacterium]MDO6708776.1 type II secretion system F family protein [Photobacterium sp. 1_MG-2023]QUJ69753.1 type II secretion system F family protein [Photobacterium sp. GJ3]